MLVLINSVFWELGTETAVDSSRGNMDWDRFSIVTHFSQLASNTCQLGATGGFFQSFKLDKIKQNPFAILEQTMYGFDVKDMC